MIHGRFQNLYISKNNEDNWFKVRYASDSLTKTYENIEIKYLTGSLMPLGNIRGVEKVEGGITGIIADGKTEGYFLKSLFLKETVAQDLPNYKHIFSIENNFTATPYVLDIVKDIQLQKRKINDYRISKFSFKLEPNSILVYDVEGKAVSESIISNAITFTLNDFTVIPSWNIVFKIDNVEYKPKSLEFSYEESTDYDYRVGSRTPISIVRGVVNSTVKIDFLLNSESILFRDKYEQDSIVAVKIEAQANNGFKWVINIPKAVINSYSETSGDEILTNSVELQVIANESDLSNSISFELINDKDTEY